MRENYSLFFEIDGEKLAKELRVRDLRKDAVSKGVGYSKNYIGYVIKEGKIRKSAMTLLESVYGINYDSIKPDEQPQEPVSDATGEEKAEQTPFDLNNEALWDKLRLVLYSSVYKAVTDALNA